MKTRLFIGLSLPRPICRQLAELPHTLEGARWSPAANLHVTLVFIGTVERHAVDSIRAALAQLSHPAFPLAVRGMGRFDTRILWAGVNNHPALHALQQRLAAALDAIGTDYDHRPFRPHITLARLRGNAAEAPLQHYICTHAELASAAFMVTQFHLYESVSTEEGSRYIPLASFSLSG